MGGGTVGVAVPRHFQQAAGRPGGNGSGQFGDVVGFNHQVVLRPAGVAASHGGLGVEVVVVGPEITHRFYRALRQPGVQLPQYRNYLAAQLIAGVALVGVGAVLHMGKVVGLQIGLDVRTWGGEQGTHQFSPAGRDTCQAVEPGSTGQVEQQGLQIVVSVVGGGDAVTAQLFRRTAEELVPQFPAGLLHPQATAGGFAVHIAPLHHAGDVPLFAEVFHKGGVSIGGLSPHPVVVVGGGHLKTTLSRQAVEQVEQADGIGPAGHGTQHLAPPGEHIVFGCEGLDGFQHKGVLLWCSCRGDSNTHCVSGRWKRRWCTRAATAAPPCRSRHDGSWQ